VQGHNASPLSNSLSIQLVKFDTVFPILRPRATKSDGLTLESSVTLAEVVTRILSLASQLRTAGPTVPKTTTAIASHISYLTDTSQSLIIFSTYCHNPTLLA
jgi:hypothetical protein